MIERLLQPRLLELATRYPVLTLTGPRQSGKTTLSRMAFPDRPHEWLTDYTATYVERDVRQLVNVGDLLLFQTFLRLCAGRTGQILNLASLASDCGISHPTARSWLSVLEASYIVFRVPPFFANLGKRLIKSPKLYFYDTGLAASLLNIESPRQIETHPLKGALFETWVVAEIAKAHLHRGRRPRFSVYRGRNGLEIDVILEKGADLVLVEVKSGQTPSGQHFSAFERFA